jgi:hypothetical protein
MSQRIPHEICHDCGRAIYEDDDYTLLSFTVVNGCRRINYICEECADKMARYHGFSLK